MTGAPTHTMAGAESGQAADRRQAWLLAAVLIVASAVRFWHLLAGVPYAVGVDEPAIVDRALRILRSGDLNTHVFDYPTLVIYLHAAVAWIAYAAGRSLGWWTNLGDIDIVPVYAACRLVAAAIGAATVWLTWRMGRDLAGPVVGLLAALQLAVLPMHVRESHYALTDVPVTAVAVLAVWLAIRAGDRPSNGGWARAGLAAGVAAAAKYNGGVALAPVVLAALLHEHRWRRRVEAALIAGMAAAAGFLLGAPYTLLDLSRFLEGFGAQMSRFSAERPLPDPVWLIYLKHLALNGGLWLPLAGIGIVALVLRPDRMRAAAPVAFAAVYLYVLATHSLVFGRYALPLTPFVCLFAATGVVALAERATAIGGWLRVWRPWLVAGVALVLVTGFAVQTARWLDQFSGPDTRRSTAEWMEGALPPGARVAVDVSGPTYLQHAGFDVTTVPRLPGEPEWYRRRRIEYAVLAWRTERAGTPALGVTLFEIAPTQRRWGPSLRVVRLDGPR